MDNKQVKIMLTPYQEVYVNWDRAELYPGFEQCFSFLIKGKYTINDISAAVEILIQRHTSLQMGILFCDDHAILQAHNTRGKSTIDGLNTRIEQVNENHFIIYFETHHVFFDGVSTTLLLEDLTDIFNGVAKAERRSDYVHFVQSYLAYRNSRKYEQDKQFWLSALVEKDSQNLRPDNHFAFIGNGREISDPVFRFDLADEDMDRLQCVTKQLSSTRFSVVFAVIAFCLADFMKENLFAISLIASVRTQHELFMVGQGTNVIPIVVDRRNRYRLDDWIIHMTHTIAESFDHMRFPQQQLIRCLADEQQIMATDLYNIMVVYHNQGQRNQVYLLDRGKLTLQYTEKPVHVKGLRFDIIEEWGQRKLKFILHYNNRLLSHEIIKEMIENLLYEFKHLFPQGEISASKRLLTTESIKKYHPHKQYRFVSCIERFDQEVMKRGEQTAVVFNGIKYNYCWIGDQINKIARFLNQLNIGRGHTVGLVMKRDIWMVTSILAVMKAGAAFLCVNAQYPAERIEQMLKIGESVCVLTNLTGYDSYSVPTYTVHDAGSCTLMTDTGFRYPREIDLAYVTVTTGTTGEPKGVFISHGSLSNLLAGLSDSIDIQGINTAIALANFSFDVIISEILWPMLNGAQIILGNDQQVRNPRYIGHLIHRYQAELLQVTPTVLDLLLLDDSSLLSSLKVVVVGGEEIPAKTLDLAKQILSSRIYNIYGLSELTVWSSVKKLEQSESITIGYPMPNIGISLMDTDEIKSSYTIGEIIISGKGMPMMIRNSMAEKIYHPSYYRTGDLGMYNGNGEILYIGRKDRLVKSHGVRINLTEIEKVIMKQPEVNKAVVLLVDHFLCAYIIAAQKELSIGKLQDTLREYLPHEMIPSKFYLETSFDYNHNGKIDYQKLIKKHECSGSPTTSDNEKEQELLNIFQDLLLVNDLEMEDDLFLKGGDSITIIIASHRIKRELGKYIDVDTLYRLKTIKQIAAYLEDCDKDHQLEH